MKTLRKLDIEIDKEINDIIIAVQRDTKSRYLDIQLFNNSVPINITNHKIRVYGFKADKKEFWNDCKIEDAENGRILLELTTQMLALANVIHLQIKIYNDEETEILSTQIFKVFGTKDLFNADAIESSNEYGSVITLFQEVFEVRMQIKEILDKIGNPGEKAEEINKKTLFEQLEWLIDFSQKNSVGSLGDKIDNIKTEIQKTGKSLLPLFVDAKFDEVNKSLSGTSGTLELININGKGKLAFANFNLFIKNNSSGSNKYVHCKIYIDSNLLFNLKLNIAENTTSYSNTVGILNANLPITSYYNGNPSFRLNNIEKVASNRSNASTMLNPRILLPFRYNNLVTGQLVQYGKSDDLLYGMVTDDFVEFKTNFKMELTYSLSVTGSSVIFRYCYI